jgi:5-methylcytosine-specific restriction enzyme A
MGQAVGWSRIRLRVLERDDYTCQIAGPRCLGIATEVDHIGDRDDHSEDNLRSACKPCHATRTWQQTLARPPRRRQPEAHPGAM